MFCLTPIGGRLFKVFSVNFFSIFMPSAAESKSLRKMLRLSFSSASLLVYFELLCVRFLPVSSCFFSEFTPKLCLLSDLYECLLSASCYLDGELFLRKS